MNARQFHVLAASDGSPSAHAALATALAFPWPVPSQARAVVALGSTAPSLGRGRNLSAAARQDLYGERGRAERLLAQRWSDAQAFALHERPAQAILSEVRRFGAHTIVLGWRGHGALRRLLAGCVSRDVVSQASVPVLVVRKAQPAVRHLVIGFDGSPGAVRAVRFARRLEHRPGSSVVLVGIIEPVPVPAARRLPASVRRTVRAEAVRINRRRAEAPNMRPPRLLRAAAGAAPRARLGSVAAGALNHSRVPVMIVK